MNNLTIIKELNDEFETECEYESANDTRSHLCVTGCFSGDRSDISDLLDEWDLRGNGSIFYESADGEIAVEPNPFGFGYADAWPKRFWFILENGQRILSRECLNGTPAYRDTFLEPVPLSTISYSMGPLIKAGALQIIATSWEGDTRFIEKLIVRANGSVQKRYQEFAGSKRVASDS